MAYSSCTSPLGSENGVFTAAIQTDMHFFCVVYCMLCCAESFWANASSPVRMLLASLALVSRCFTSCTCEFGLHAYHALSLRAHSSNCVWLGRYLTRTTFDVFNCLPTNPPDGAKYGYLQVVFEPCYVQGGLQMRLLPWAIVTMIVYTFGYPGVVLYIMVKVCIHVRMLVPVCVG